MVQTETSRWIICIGWCNVSLKSLI